MKTSIDIEKAVVLLNSKKTTVDELCKFLFADIEQFKDTREAVYMKEFKQDCEDQKVDPNLGDVYVEEMYTKIQKDIVKFVNTYADASIDKVLDAINEKKFKSKRGVNNLLVLLSTMKETYSDVAAKI